MTRSIPVTLPVVNPQDLGLPGAARDRDANRRWLIAAITSLFLVAVAHVFDVWAWAHVHAPNVYEHDSGRMFRMVGYYPTWIIVSVAILLHDRPAPGWRWRGALLLLVPAVTGIASEVVKLLVRRERPNDLSPAYAFRPFHVDPWSTRGLGMASGHTMVAFGAATVLARIFPRAWWLWYLIAAGCAYTRILARAHFLSDTVAAAALAWLIADLFLRWGLRKRAIAIGRAAVDAVTAG